MWPQLHTFKKGDHNSTPSRSVVKTQHLPEVWSPITLHRLSIRAYGSSNDKVTDDGNFTVGSEMRCCQHLTTTQSYFLWELLVPEIVENDVVLGVTNLGNSAEVRDNNTPQLTDL